MSSRDASRILELFGSRLFDLLIFRLMITPVLIQVKFWLGTMVCILVGLRLLFEPARWLAESHSRQTESSGSYWFILAGLIILVMGPLTMRIYCELLIVIFKIHDELKAANDARS